MLHVNVPNNLWKFLINFVNFFFRLVFIVRYSITDCLLVYINPLKKCWLNLDLVFQLYIGKPLFLGRNKNEIMQEVRDERHFLGSVF